MILKSILSQEFGHTESIVHIMQCITWIKPQEKGAGIVNRRKMGRSGDVKQYILKKGLITFCNIERAQYGVIKPG